MTATKPPGAALPPGAEAAAAADAIAIGRRRLRDAAMALPFAGLLLLASPLVLVFAVDGRVFGVPVVVAYIFLAWAALIAAARAVGRGILAAADAEARSGPGGTRPGAARRLRG
ncbi:MAG: hypothetical protein AAF371_03005 [Pseudomonadota bacterium]